MVAYVDSHGSDSSCRKSAPCGTLRAALAVGRPFIKVHGTIDDTATVSGGRSVTVLADPGAALTRAVGETPVLTVQDDGTTLAIYDLAIADIQDTRAVAILVPASGSPLVSLTRVSISNNAGSGISIARGMLALTKSVIRTNTGGGVVASGDARFAIVGNVFFQNGSANSISGGIDISTIESPNNRLEFNTFYRNAAQAGVGAAIHCIAGMLIARNNIVFDNTTVANALQIDGNCEHTFSIVQPGMPPPAGEGNLAADPLFRNPAAGDLHPGPGSPARGASDPASDLTGLAALDLDGVPRVAPATTGAYQMP